MSTVTGWIFVIGCAVGTPADQCIEEPVNGYAYNDVQSCQMDNAGDPRPNMKCIEVIVVRDAGEDPAAGSIERILHSFDDSAGRG